VTEPGYPPPATAPGPTPPPYAPGLSGAEAAAAAPAPSRAKKWLGAAGSIVVAGVAAASWFGIGGASVPEVGDCVTADGATSFEVVDCGGDDAEHRVVGIEPEEMTYEAYMADDGLCAGFDTAQMVLWVGEEGSDGTVLCAEPV
jgi:hypothetical protein